MMYNYNVTLPRFMDSIVSENAHIKKIHAELELNGWTQVQKFALKDNAPEIWYKRHPVKTTQYAYVHRKEILNGN